jgi:hypothetical protein
MGDNPAMYFLVTAAGTDVEPARNRPHARNAERLEPINAGRPTAPGGLDQFWPPVAYREMGDWLFFGGHAEIADVWACRVQTRPVPAFIRPRTGRAADQLGWRRDCPYPHGWQT